ncbi:MAG: MYG1 family protein [Alphaproteobacteria bacterium]|nr:MYG1 family protein [Alphaproteobacteria bacterium]
MLKVATHAGTFHADDVFAFAILRAAAGPIELTRSRDAAVLAGADVVFDVGGVFDRAARRYDHHMRDKPQRPSGEPYSSAGLVWRDYGEAAIRALLPTASPDSLGRIAAMVDGGLIRDVDLMDNGAMTPTPGHFSTVVEAFNATFAENDRDENEAFMRAADLASAVLARVCARAHAAVLAEQGVAEAAAAAQDPRIIVLDRRIPWEDAVFDLDLAQALYVVRPAGDAWTCSAVPPKRGSFEQRLPLPDAWGGLRDEALVAETGVADATFCHPARFVCGARSQAGAVALAKAAAG